MKIGMVLYGVDFPPDIRVEKESAALIAAGHRVSLICSGAPSRPSEAAGVSISRFPAMPSGVAKIRNSLGFYSAFRFPYWGRALFVWAVREKVEVLHVHDLQMATTALVVAKRLELPVVVDLHENYPAVMREWRQPQGLRKLFRIHERYGDVELRVARRAQKMITVVPEANDRFLEAGLPESKLVVVSNTEPLSYGDDVLGRERDARFGDDIVLSYAGGFAPHRGLEMVVRAMPRLLAHNPSYRLVLAGDGPSGSELRKLASSLELGDRVEFWGWVKDDGVRSLAASTDVGLVPHVKSEHTETTIPHKLFQYMVSARAVAVSECAPLRRVVGETGCGIVVEDASPEGWAGALSGIDRERAAALGAAGRAACERQYNWGIDAARLVDMYDGMK